MFTGIYLLSQCLSMRICLLFECVYKDIKSNQWLTFTTSICHVLVEVLLRKLWENGLCCVSLSYLCVCRYVHKIISPRLSVYTGTSSVRVGECNITSVSVSVYNNTPLWVCLAIVRWQWCIQQYGFSLCACVQQYFCTICNHQHLVTLDVTWRIQYVCSQIVCYHLNGTTCL